MLDLLRLTLPDSLFAQGTVASLTRLGRGLVADFAVVALAAALGVTVDSESSLRQLCNELFWIHSCVRLLPRSSSDLPGSSL